MADVHVGWTLRGPMGVIPGLDGHPDGVPTSVHGTLMDHDEVQLAGDGELFIKSPYQAWRSEDTRVVSYMLYHSPEYKPPFIRQGWRAAPNAREARRQVLRDFGTILEENAAGDNVFFRVYKETR